MFFSLPADNQVLPLLRSNAAMDPVEGTSNGEGPNSHAVSFTVGFEEPAKNPKRMPKHLRSKRKAELSEATIAEKQKLAEKRRKVLYAIVHELSCVPCAGPLMLYT